MAIGEVHSELSRKPKMEFFEKITVFLLLTIFVTNSILHVWLGFEYTSALQNFSGRGIKNNQRKVTTSWGSNVRKQTKNTELKKGEAASK